MKGLKLPGPLNMGRSARKGQMASFRSPLDSILIRVHNILIFLPQLLRSERRLMYVYQNWHASISSVPRHRGSKGDIIVGPRGCSRSFWFPASIHSTDSRVLRFFVRVIVQSTPVFAVAFTAGLSTVGRFPARAPSILKSDGWQSWSATATTVG